LKRRGWHHFVALAVLQPSEAGRLASTAFISGRQKEAVAEQGCCIHHSAFGSTRGKTLFDNFFERVVLKKIKYDF
jgi:hypothetical protein